MPDDPKINITENVMSAIKKEQVTMKPKWHFVLGSVLMTGGLTGLAILSIFFISVISFSFRTHGGMGSMMRYERFLTSFPWGAVVVATIGVGLGSWLLKKYDFSYKRNFPLLIISALVAILFAGWLVNYTGLDALWMKKGPMKDFYKHYDGGAMMRGPGWRMMQNNGL
jgi:hypothetical protein